MLMLSIGSIWTATRKPPAIALFPACRPLPPHDESSVTGCYPVSPCRENTLPPNGLICNCNLFAFSYQPS
ncbi:Hypothetical protein GbCGDNIH2_7201a [Granulibacter bethesdensis]|nr:Hypothetical protein GbCGDNIH2_7201a [Granulibacter bethesdensis]